MAEKTWKASPPDIMANLRLIDSFKEEGVIEDYAVSGAIAGEIYGEPRTVQNLELIVSPGTKETIERLENEIAERGAVDEYSKGRPRLNGFAISFIPAEGIFRDALDASLVKRLPGGMKVRFVLPEYLLVLLLEPEWNDWLPFAFDLCDYHNLDFRLVARIVQKHGKSGIYRAQDEKWHFKDMRQQSIKAIWRTPKQFKHKVKYHRENARMPLFKKVEHINGCCALYLEMARIRMNWKQEKDKKKQANVAPDKERKG